MSQTFILDGSPERSELPQYSDGPEVRERLAAVKAEVAEIRESCREIGEMDPSEIMRHISSCISRLGVLRGEIIDGKTKAHSRLRIDHIDPLREDLKLLYDVNSRFLSALQFEWETSGGQ